ncbi:MAG: ATP-binding protein [Alphaproteobacteria bacterium]|nr:ATP-binding protein [Alphaproteobacteria bacterium]
MGIDLLNLKPSVISKDLREKYLLLAGAPKIGKTEFCSLAPDALILAFEMGTNARPGVLVQPIEKWTDFKLALRQLEKPEAKEKFATICIDTVGIAYDLCEKFICQQAGVQKIGDIPYGGGYSALSKEFETSLRKITMLGYGLIMTCHLKENTNSDGDVIGYKPDLNNRCLKIVNGLVDIIGVITQSWNEKGESERWIQTRATPTITAGSRFRYLEPKIRFGYQEFVDALARAIEAEEKHGAVVVETTEKNTEEKVDFNSLRKEAQELWTELVGKDEENAVIILKKIEIIMGRKMKLSEFTEDQADLMALVVAEMREMK